MLDPSDVLEAAEQARRALEHADPAAVTPKLAGALRGLRASAERLLGGDALPKEIERKFLLSGAPPKALAAPAETLEQGWIPGEAIHERLRSIRRGRATQYRRTIKLGRGAARIEVEEPLSKALFDRLWPLTLGKRVRKRRHRVKDGALVWEVDVFADRALVLAEVELPSDRVKVALPRWLMPYVVREVTGEDAFVNLNLAR